MSLFDPFCFAGIVPSKLIPAFGRLRAKKNHSRQRPRPVFEAGSVEGVTEDVIGMEAWLKKKFFGDSHITGISMKLVDLIIFDLDGTLVDSRRDIADAVNFTLNGLGLKEKSMREIASYIGGGVDVLLKCSLGEKKGDLFGKAVELFEKYYRVHSTDKSVLYPGVKDILEYFKSKKKAVVTNRKHEFAVITLKDLGIYSYFEYITGGDNLNCMKPSPCPLDAIIDRFDIEKERAIIVGDMHIDVLSAKNAGITACAVTYGIGKKEDIIKADPDFVIDNIAELKNIIY